MSTIYLSLNQPITTKYLKQGGEATDIEQMKEDIEQLQEDVAELQTSDTTQNTAITNLQTSDTTQNTAITNLQTSDTTQNAYIDRMKHEIVLLSGYAAGDNLAHKEATWTPMVYLVEKSMDRGNNSKMSTTFCAKLWNIGGIATNPLTINFGAPSNIATDLEYYYYTCPTPSLNGFYIVNGFGEDVLNNHIVKIGDVPSGQTYVTLNDLMRLYGTDYYKQHYNDTFNFDYLSTTATRVLNLSEWLKTYYSSTDFNEMTNLKNWVDARADPTNAIKTDLTSTWSSSDYETMTNLKNWVVSKATGTSAIKCPVDMFISSEGSGSPYLSHQVAVRVVSPLLYKIGGQTCENSGYYIAFHSELVGLPRITSITVIAIKSGQTFPTFSWDSLCKFYGTPFGTDDPVKFGGLYFIMNDGTTCICRALGYQAFALNEVKYVHFLSDVIVFDALMNNVCGECNYDEIEPSTATYDTSRKPYYKFTGSEGSFRDYSELQVITN